MSADVRTDVVAIQDKAKAKEASAKSTDQSIANLSSACMNLGAVMALSLGATHLDVDPIITDANNSDAGTQWADHATFFHLKGLFKLLALGCSATGVSPDEILLLQKRIADADQASKIIDRQNAAYLDGCFNMTALLAAKLGASSSDITSVEDEVKSKNSNARTVFQEMTNYLKGLAQMNALAASARGVPNTTVQPLLLEMQNNDLNSTSIYREQSALWASNLKLLGILAIGKN